MTKNEAIRKATDRCTPIYKVHDSRYTFDVQLDSAFELQRQAEYGYKEASLARTAFIINESRRFLGLDPVEYKPRAGTRFDAWI
jgi:hypothetical protein